MTNVIKLFTLAREHGAGHGWNHANFCEAYGWAEHGGNVTTNRTPRELTRYLLAGITSAVEMSDAQFEVLCLQVYGEYLAGFIDGIEEFEADTEQELP